MILLRIANLTCSIATAIAAFAAAFYWYLSSRPAPETTVRPVASISDNPGEHVLGAQVDIINIRATLYQASRLNKKAAMWSGVAAFLGGISAALGFL